MSDYDLVDCSTPGFPVLCSRRQRQHFAYPPVLGKITLSSKIGGIDSSSKKARNSVLFPCSYSSQEISVSFYQEKQKLRLSRKLRYGGNRFIEGVSAAPVLGYLK